MWTGERPDLLMLPDITISELLERIPGLVPVRGGVAGQPEGVAVFGTAAAGIRYFLDGFPLDPLSTASYDPSRIPLLALSRIRVERRMTGADVHLETLSPTDPRPHSIVEAATGDLGINLFRGMFLAPSVLGGPLAAGFERLATEAAGSSNLTAGWLKWTFVRDSAGIQLEYRQTDLDRTGIGTGLSSERRDWVLRARGRLLGLTVDGYAGASTLEDDDGSLVVQEGTPQAGIRIHERDPLGLPLGTAAWARFRDHPRLPRTETGFELWTALGSWGWIGSEFEWGLWAEGEPTRRQTARLKVGPLLGLSAFAEATGGDGAATRVLAPVDSVVLAPTRDGLRFGLSFDRWGAHLGAAVIRAEADTAAGFGVGFDPTPAAWGGGEATGFEAALRLPTGWEPLRLEGWYVGLDAPESWLYTPEHHWRAALVYHDSPLPSGNLEIYARVEHLFRGRMTTPCSAVLNCLEPTGETVPPPDGLTAVGSYRATNLELTIRVVTVRAFVRWENAFNRRFQQDLPMGTGASLLALPGQHILYGVKWEFWN